MEYMAKLRAARLPLVTLWRGAGGGSDLERRGGHGVRRLAKETREEVGQRRGRVRLVRRPKDSMNLTPGKQDFFGLDAVTSPDEYGTGPLPNLDYTTIQYGDHGDHIRSGNGQCES